MMPLRWEICNKVPFCGLGPSRPLLIFYSNSAGHWRNTKLSIAPSKPTSTMEGGEDIYKFLQGVRKGLFFC